MEGCRPNVIQGCVLAALIILFFGCSTPRVHESTYEGKPVSAWMDDLTNSWAEGELLVNIQAREDALTNMVRQLGAEALPLYLTWLLDRDHPGRSYGSQKAFEILGSAAAPTIPDLAELLRGDKTADIAAYCLGAIGPTAIPALTNAIATLTNRGCGQAISTLARFGPAAESATPLLIRIVNSGSPLADPAMRTLVEIQTNVDLLMPVFSSHIADSNSAPGAAYALGRLGNPGVAVLLQTLTNDARNIRCFAAGALDPGFRNYVNEDGSTPRFMLLSCIYNQKAMGAAWRSYSQGDFIVAAEIASRYTNDADSSIRTMAGSVLNYLKPMAETNIPRMKKDEENGYLPRREF